MNSHGFSSAVVAARGHLLYRVDGVHSGNAYWSYVLVDAPKLEASKKAVGISELVAQDYGTVLVWGQGDVPPEHVAQDLKTTYGFEVIA